MQARTITACRQYRGSRGRISVRRRIVLVSSAVMLAGSCLAMPLRANAADKHEIARGKYLVTVASCTDCHTPGHFFGKRDMTKFLGGSDVGFAIPGLGVFVGPNLTPDKATGLGNWTPAQIVDRDRPRERRRRDARWRPVMPWHDYANLTKADALAIAAYLKSLPPMSNQVPGPFGPTETPTTFVMTVLPGAVYAHLANPPPPPPPRRPAQMAPPPPPPMQMAPPPPAAPAPPEPKPT